MVGLVQYSVSISSVSWTMGGGCGEDGGRKVGVAIGLGDSLIRGSDSRGWGVGGMSWVMWVGWGSGAGRRVVGDRVLGVRLRSDSGDRKKV